MSHKKEIITAVGTLAVAVGIGFVMQSSETAKQRYGKEARPAIDAPAVAAPAEAELEQVDADIVLAVEAIELTSATEVSALSVPVPESDPRVQRVSTPGPATLPPVAEDVTPQVEACDMTARAVVRPGAMVELSLFAPCAPNERLTVHHSGMMFTESTDADGLFTVTVPAMARDAVFIMAFSSGDGAVAQATVEDMDQYDRVALQWRGKAGFQLHAREFGADYGAEGHVWFGAMPDIAGLQSGEGGFLMRMGDDRLAEPLLAEVYTFASGMTARSGTIDLSVEAEVTADNCGLEIEAQSLEIEDGGSLKTRDLTLSVPACDAVGSFLVLNNLVSDLKVARN